MYKNLKAEMTRADLTIIELTKLLNIKSNGTLSLKINGKAKFTLNEAFKIKKILNEKLNKDLTIEYLFDTEERTK